MKSIPRGRLILYKEVRGTSARGHFQFRALNPTSITSSATFVNSRLTRHVQTASGLQSESYLAILSHHDSSLDDGLQGEVAMSEYRKNKATFHASPPASVSPSRARVPPGVPLSRPSPPAAAARRRPCAGAAETMSVLKARLAL